MVSHHLVSTSITHQVTRPTHHTTHNNTHPLTGILTNTGMPTHMAINLLTLTTTLIHLIPTIHMIFTISIMRTPPMITVMEATVATVATAEALAEGAVEVDVDSAEVEFAEAGEVVE